MIGTISTLSSLMLQKRGRIRSFSFENPSGEKGGGGKAASELGPGRKGEPFIRDLKPGTVAELVNLEGPGVIRHFFITVTDLPGTGSLERLILRMYWEDREEPAVECSLGAFFGCGDGRIREIQTLPVVTVPARSFHCFYPMPFQSRARITLENKYLEKISVVAYQVTCTAEHSLPDKIRLFYLPQYNQPEIMEDMLRQYAKNEREENRLPKGAERSGDMNSFVNSMDTIMFQKKGQSRAINQENPTGEKGKGGMAASNLGPGRKGAPCIRDVEPGETRVLADIDGCGVIQHIWITVTDRTEKDYYVLRDLVLRMYWDGEETPSVESPLGDFFCCGFGRDCVVNSMPIVVNPARGFNCYFPMPFRKKARITIENQHEAAIPAFFYQVDYTLYDELPEDVAYFHAQWRRERLTELQKDYTILDGVRGKGHYVGTYMALATLERYWWGEGELKVYLDGDEEYPTICGTGTEDYFGGSWSFASVEDSVTKEHTYNTPFMGYPYFSREDSTVFNPYHMNDKPTERGFYRWHIMDPILFEQDIRVTIQQIGVCHKGLFERQDDVSSVAYWYQSEPHQAFKPLLPKEQRWPR